MNSLNKTSINLSSQFISPLLLSEEGSEGKPDAAGCLCSKGLGTFSWNFHIFSLWYMLSQIMKMDTGDQGPPLLNYPECQSFYLVGSKNLSGNLNE